MANVTTAPISVRPESGVYATYRRIAYRPWAAIAEFVDNSTQNFQEHKEEIAAVEGNPPTLELDIVYDSDARTLMVADTANGMDFEELTRAIQLNRPPPVRSGRSEYGMGLKMAACWFGNRWKIVTKRLNSDIEYEATVDVESFAANNPSAIDVLQRGGMDPKLHYTRVEIERLHRLFRGRTVTNIKDNIASIYRRDITSGEVVMRWNGEPFQWEKDPVWIETLPDGTKVPWKKSIAFEVDGLKVSGKVWLMLPGAFARAGMHLFRRGRLIVGGPGSGYKPWDIFKAPNSFWSQRLIGELDLDDWPVTQTKDEFDWSGELESQFVEKLREEVADYIDKAPHLGRDGSGGPTKGDAELAGDITKDSLAGREIDEAILIVEQGPPPEPEPEEKEAARVRGLIGDAGNPTYVAVGSQGVPRLNVYWKDTLSPADIYADFACPNDDELHLVVNLKHPFVTDVLGRDAAKLEVFSQMLFVDALVERGIRRRGEPVHPGAFRVFKDQYLRRVSPGQ